MLGLVLVTSAVVALGEVWPLFLPVALVAALVTLAATLYFGRTFFRGRAAMRAQRYDEAIALFETFRTERATAALPLLWFSLYTSDPVALALNNIGACHLSAHRPERAAPPLDEAVLRDPGYALPRVNLAIAHRLLGDEARSRSHAEAARALGFGRDALETALRKAAAATNVRLGAGLG
jgi:hypothetical protein